MVGHAQQGKYENNYVKFAANRMMAEIPNLLYTRLSLTAGCAYVTAISTSQAHKYAISSPLYID